MPDLKDLTLEHFTPLVGSRFRLDTGDAEAGALDVELAEAAPMGSRSSVGERRQPFRLVFLGPRQPPLGQRIYQLGHAEMGQYEVFLVPIAEDAEHRHYEAVFT